jgi:hypothetical protein
MGFQGSNHDAAPSVDVMLLNQKFLTVSGSNQRLKQAFHYADGQQHRLLQFLLLKLEEWIAKNLVEELNLPDTGD